MTIRLSRRGAWLVVLVVAIVTGALGYQVRHFEIDASAETLLTRNNAKYIEYTLLRQVFAPEEFLLVAYRPTQGALFSAQTFDRLRELRGELQSLDRVRTVRSVLDVPFPTLADAGSFSDFDTGKLSVDTAGWAPSAVAMALEDHPIYENLIVDEEQTVTALQVLFEPDDTLEELEAQKVEIRRAAGDEPLSEEQEARIRAIDEQMAPIEKRLTEQRAREIETIRAIIADYEGEADIYLGGVHALGKQLIDIVRSDLVVFGGTVLLLITVLLFLLFRDLRWIVVCFACCFSSIVCTIGLFGTLGLKATAISANFVALQLILTLAIAVHLIVQFRELARTDSGRSVEALAADTLAAKAAPIVYAAGSTIIGFAALLVSDIQPVISFGWMMSIAMAVTLAVTLSLFPALLILMGHPGAAREPEALRRALARLAHTVTTHRWIIVAATTAFIAICVAGLFRLDVENSFIDYFADDTDAHRELTFIDRHLGGSTPLDIVVEVPKGEGDLLLTAETFTDLQKIQALVERHDGVGKILSLVNFTELAREVNDGMPITEYEMTAAYKLMDEELRESLIGSYYSPGSDQARFSIRIQDTTENLDRSALLEALRADVEAVLGDSADYTMSSLFVLYEDILQKLSRSQVQSLLIVFVALLLAFIAFFRSLKLAVIALVPNLLVVATVFGTMAWFGIALDLMTMTIAAVAMGIAVDDTVHYMHRFLQEVRTGDMQEAVAATNTSVGVAMCYTTIILVAGFLALLFSDFVPTTLFGLLTGVALTSALLFDLTVLPVLLTRFARRSAG